MELYQEIIAKELEKTGFRGDMIEIEPKELVELRCYQALKKIKYIVEDDLLEDIECFHRIEQIVCALEELGTDGGNRHDFV